MKKQFLTVLLSLLLTCGLCSASLAEDALAKAAAGTLEVLTQTEDGAIYRYTAPNGQAVYFNSDSAEEDEDAVTRYGINNLKLCFENDVRFLEQF